MRALLCVALSLAAAITLCGRADAADISGEVENKLDTAAIVRALPESASELMEGVTPSPGENFSLALRRVLSGCRAVLGEAFLGAGKSAGMMLVCAALCAMLSAVFKGRGETDFAELASCLSIALIAAGDIGSCLQMGSKAISEISDFSKVLLPVMTSSAALSGAAGSAAAKYAATALFMDVLITTTQRLLAPLVYAYFAAVTAECAFGAKSLSGVAVFLKWLAGTLLTVIVLAFVVYLGVTGIVAGTADAAAVRVAKTALATGLPVVGGIISDAAAAVLTGAGLVKNAAGVFGLVAVLAICASPIIRIGTHYLVYKAASKLALSFAGEKTVKTAEGTSAAFGIMLAAAGACALMLFFSIISFVGAVT